MRCGEEEDFGTGVGDVVPGEGKDLVGVMVACDGELRMDVFEIVWDGGLWFAGAA